MIFYLNSKGGGFPYKKSICLIIYIFWLSSLYCLSLIELIYLDILYDKH